MWDWLVFSVAIRDGEALSSGWNYYWNNNWTTLSKFLSYMQQKYLLPNGFYKKNYLYFWKIDDFVSIQPKKEGIKTKKNCLIISEDRKLNSNVVNQAL